MRNVLILSYVDPLWFGSHPYHSLNAYMFLYYLPSLSIADDIFLHIFSKVPAFFEFKLKSSFVILDILISVKWNKDSVNTFSLIIFTPGWSLNFSSVISSGSPKAILSVPKLSQYSVISNFVIEFWKYLLSVLATYSSSEIISFLLSHILFFSVLSSSFLSISVILDY